MAIDGTPAGNDGKPIRKFGFVKAIMSFTESSKPGRFDIETGRVIDTVVSEANGGEPGIVVEFEGQGNPFTKVLEPRAISQAKEPRTWLGTDTKDLPSPIRFSENDSHNALGLPELLELYSSSPPAKGTSGEFVLFKKRAQVHIGVVVQSPGEKRGMTGVPWMIRSLNAGNPVLMSFSTQKKFRSVVKAFDGDLTPAQVTVLDEIDESVPLDLETGLHTKVSGRNKKLLARELGPDEKVRAVVEYTWPMGNQALVATDNRLMVLKTGIGAGTLGGGRVSSFNWDHITGIQVNTGLVQATIVIQTPGMGATVPGDFFTNRAKKDKDPFQLPNVIPVDKATIGRYRADLEWIKKRQREGAPQVLLTPQTEPSSISKLDQLRQLGELRDSGVLSEEEFERMKAEIMDGPI